MKHYPLERSETVQFPLTPKITLDLALCCVNPGLGPKATKRGLPSPFLRPASSVPPDRHSFPPLPLTPSGAPSPTLADGRGMARGLRSPLGPIQPVSPCVQIPRGSRRWTAAGWTHRREDVISQATKSDRPEWTEPPAAGVAKSWKTSFRHFLS